MQLNVPGYEATFCKKRFVEDALYYGTTLCFSFKNKSVTTMNHLYRYCSYAYKYTTKGMVWFYIALYPVHWTAQSALHIPPLADLFIPTPFSASLGSILAMQQLRNDYSLTFPPLSIARYSFIQLSRLRRREVKENAQTSKRYQRDSNPGSLDCESGILPLSHRAPTWLMY